MKKVLIFILLFLSVVVYSHSNDAGDSSIPEYIYIRKMMPDPRFPGGRLNTGEHFPPQHTPVSQERVCVESDEFYLDILIGRQFLSEPEDRTQRLIFTVNQVDDKVQLIISDKNIKKGIGGDGFDRNIDVKIEHYSSLLVPKNEWTQIFYNEGYQKRILGVVVGRDGIKAIIIRV